MSMICIDPVEVHQPMIEGLSEVEAFYRILNNRFKAAIFWEELARESSEKENGKSYAYENFYKTVETLLAEILPFSPQKKDVEELMEMIRSDKNEAYVTVIALTEAYYYIAKPRFDYKEVAKIKEDKEAYIWQHHIFAIEGIKWLLDQDKDIFKWYEKTLFDAVENFLLDVNPSHCKGDYVDYLYRIVDESNSVYVLLNEEGYFADFVDEFGQP